MLKNILVITIFLISFSLSSKDNEFIILFNAASTTDLMEEISDLYTKESGIDVKTSPAASGTLIRQIEMGADADVYISASLKWIEYARTNRLVLMDSPFISNNLVLIAPITSKLNEVDINYKTDFKNLFSGRISIGDPDFVPAGSYAKGALEYFGWYKDIVKRVQPGQDVRAALRVVEQEECELGIVYSSDAEKSKLVKVVGTFPTEAYPKIQYFIGLTTTASENGKKFYNFVLTNPAVRDLFIKYGFIPN